MIGLEWDSLGARSDGGGFKGGFKCIGALAIHSYQTECDAGFVNIKLCLMLFNTRAEILH